uniref:Uncharacterized protein n=1 Tax=Anguilla anguilla TaxID=7936 RepID=A0A0E9PCC5_ANGAN
MNVCTSKSSRLEPVATPTSKKRFFEFLQTCYGPWTRLTRTGLPFHCC